MRYIITGRELILCYMYPFGIADKVFTFITLSYNFCFILCVGRFAWIPHLELKTQFQLGSSTLFRHQGRSHTMEYTMTLLRRYKPVLILPGFQH